MAEKFKQSEVSSEPRDVADLEDAHNLWPFPIQDFGFKNYVIVPDVLDAEECQWVKEMIDSDHPARKERTIEGNPPTHHAYWHTWISTAYAWLYERMTDICLDVNREHYRFGLSGMAELQRGLRHDVGDSTGMHCDTTEIDLSKLAWTVCVQPAQKGGELFLATFGDINLKAGEACFFPAMMGHGVNKVTKGTRYVFAGWAVGPRFV